MCTIACVLSWFWSGYGFSKERKPASSARADYFQHTKDLFARGLPWRLLKSLREPPLPFVDWHDRVVLLKQRQMARACAWAYTVFELDYVTASCYMKCNTHINQTSPPLTLLVAVYCLEGFLWFRPYRAVSG